MVRYLLLCGLVLSGLLAMGFVGCSPQSSTTDGDGLNLNINQNTDEPGAISVTMQADFGAGDATQMAPGNKQTECPVGGLADDNPSLAAGLDCDGDGGPVAYVTPSSFKVAVKRLAFVKGDGTEVEIIADSLKLVQSTVLDLTSPVLLPEVQLTEGAYPHYRAELYYFELRMPLNNPPVTQTLRLYLSDDDFPQEGSLGHHQGDITLIDENGTELGWVPPGGKWEVGTVLTTRPTGEIGAGGTDAQTGHTRGLFGNTELWDAEANTQGAGQDILTLQGPLGLVVGAQGQAVTFSFTAKDAWFFEDFDLDGVFGPCQNESGPADACTEGGAWAAIFYSPTTSIE